MKVLVVGAAGKTGRAVVEKAVQRGHEVTAFVHSHSVYPLSNVTVRVGDARDATAVTVAVAGQDAVIDTVGGKTPYKRTTLEQDVARTLIGAMQQTGVRRLIVTSSVPVGDSAANSPMIVKILAKTFLRASTPDKAFMETAVRRSGLDWVITRPAVLTDKPATGEVGVYLPHTREKARTITRADLATFLIDQLTSDLHLNSTVTLGSTPSPR